MFCMTDIIVLILINLALVFVNAFVIASIVDYIIHKRNDSDKKQV